MNASVHAPQTNELGDIDDFVECCATHAWFYDCGWISKQAAVDNLQGLAERWLLIDEVGQDEVQAIMAAAFTTPAEQVDPLSDYAAQLVRQWEFQDPRDRWKIMGERPPPQVEPESWPPKRPCCTAQSTIDAFFFVARNGHADEIANWLAAHPLDVQHLHEIWGRKCATAA